MHVKNHMAMWLLWFLWILRVEYSAKRLYKPLCAFWVFVDLVWFLCGSFCGFWSRVVFGFGLARPIHLMWFWWIGGLALDAEADDCASFCSLWFGGLAIDADAVGCASTCPQVLRVLWVPLLSKDCARTASVS